MADFLGSRRTGSEFYVVFESSIPISNADKVAELEKLRNEVLMISVSDAEASVQRSDLKTGVTKATERSSAGPS